MIILYERADCPFCWKIRLAMFEMGVSYRSVPVQFGEKHPDVARLSPTGSVPVMVDGDIVIWESSIMVDYLDRIYGPGYLIPTEARQEARIRSLHAYSDKLVGASLRDLVFEKRSKPEDEWDLSVIRASEEKWQACLLWLDAQLSGETCFAEGFTAADAALGTRFGVAEAYGAGVTDAWPSLYRWFTVLRERPSWEMAYPMTFLGQRRSPA